jgi:hypothetical protein
MLLIHSLPPELLAHVFSYLLEPVPQPFPFPLPETFHGWKVVTHVCRFWRTTALSTPSLWPRIHISRISDEAALHTIPLTGELPLVVYYTADFSDVSYGALDTVEDESLKVIQANLRRLREFHVFCSSSESLSLWKYFDRPAPLLESLTIISIYDDNVETPSVLPPLFGGQTISLGKLVMGNVSIWPYRSFQDLRHLALYDQLDETRLPLRTFLDTLSQSPHLESLILVSAGLEDEKVLDTSELIQPLSIPSLQYLELGEWSFEMVPLMFLKNVILPPDLTICLWNIGWEVDLRNLLCPRLENRSLLERCTKINVTSHLDGDSTCEADILMGVKDSTLYYYGKTVPPGFSTMRSLGIFVNVTELNYCPESQWSKYGDIIDEDLLFLLPALKILRVSKVICGHLERLCSLLIQFESDTKRTQPLSRASARAPELPANHLRFRIAPFLEELYITNPYDHPEFFEPLKPYTLDDLLPLALLVNVRANSGVTLKKLVIQGCSDEVVAASNAKPLRFDGWKCKDIPSSEIEDVGLDLFFEKVEFWGERYNFVPYWEDSVVEIWPREKLARPPHPDCW